MIDSSIREDILSRLEKTEEKYDVKILMAIESGSRAWGFASPNSDYDVRFIYANKPDWYLAVDLEDKRDVIEYPIVDDIDLNGWDVRKALKLFWKSNPAFVEWIQSPISYIDDGDFRHESLKLLPEIYSAEKGIYHYRSMAKTNYRGYLREDMVPLKKYFYVLRPLFSIQWLESYGTAAPIEFDRVLSLVTDNELLDTIHALLERKKVSEEKMLAPAIPVLNRYIEKQLERLEDIKLPKSDRSFEMAQLNELFHKVLGK
ncbi:nucleotidyltransferase domain-containing protein [Thalassolituus oleivorans]|jgi:predicted nucleotidyltransferase|uniref:Putative nucleotidyltransferase n=1 Tax=Thalassolituus oleivorans MIL-1 TaxID=1298593 RepID=M5E241_9GAMM|nr:nucleotidyltransferase domain-containing protein [Thalassolituus oleivorans]MCA6129404.1 nucleotidyltransferase [Thalassolituus oleivorans 4BN06-13]CCU71644.1 putative nucleotidyltransferase [Thalassolituus oleivorans MIL-1]